MTKRHFLFNFIIFLTTTIFGVSLATGLTKNSDSFYNANADSLGVQSSGWSKRGSTGFEVSTKGETGVTFSGLQGRGDYKDSDSARWINEFSLTSVKRFELEVPITSGKYRAGFFFHHFDAGIDNVYGPTAHSDFNYPLVNFTYLTNYTDGQDRLGFNESHALSAELGGVNHAKSISGSTVSTFAGNAGDGTIVFKHSSSHPVSIVFSVGGITNVLGVNYVKVVVRNNYPDASFNSGPTEFTLYIDIARFFANDSKSTFLNVWGMGDSYGENVPDITVSYQNATTNHAYTVGNLPSGVASLTAHKVSSYFGGGSTGDYTTNTNFRYGDMVYWSAEASTGYSVSVPNYNSASNLYHVSSAVNGASVSGVTATAHTGSITYNLNGGTHGATHPSSYTYGNSFYVSAPTRAGYTFTGWTVTSGLNTSTAKWGKNSSPSTAISSSSIKCVNGESGNVYFLNLNPGNSASVTLTANWTIKSYTITWKNHDGTTLETDSVNYNIKPTYDGATPTKASTAQYEYTFTGWSPTIVVATADQTYTAQFSQTVRKYTVSFNMKDHGTAPSSQTIDYGAKVTKPTDPTATGYTFGGWYKESSCTNVWNFTSDTISGNTVLYAKWTPTNYNISYTLNGGSATNPTSYNIETSTFTLNNPVKAGYTFTGWSGTGISGTSTSVSVTKGSTGNRAYTANWTINTYTITWKNHDGTTLETDTVNYNVTPTYDGATPTKASTAQYEYTFTGWSPNVVAATADQTYTAQFSETVRKYTVSAYVDSTYMYGTISDTSITDVPYGSEITINDTNKSFTVNGKTITAIPFTSTAEYTYKFIGWKYTNPLTVTGNKGLIACFSRTKNSYTVNFNMQGHGTAPSSQTIDYGAKVTKPTDPTATGYTFGGWYKESSCTNVWNFTSDTISGNTVLYAKWTPQTYSITYNGLEGATVSSNPTSYNIETSTFTLNNPEKVGYTFTGWSGTGISGTSTSVSVTKGSTGDRAYTANWEIIDYTVTLNVNNGNYGTLSRTTITAHYGDAVTVNGNKITINGTTVTATPASDNVGYHYEFSNWSNNPSTITGNVTITANFNRISGESAAISFAQGFNSDIGSKCLPGGGTPKSNLSSPWANEATAYKQLDGYVVYWLTNSTNTDIRNFLAKYDYVNNKYGQSYELEDFMNRRSTYNSVRNDLFFLISGNNDITSLIVIVGASAFTIIVSSLSIILIKKRKNIKQGR